MIARVRSCLLGAIAVSALAACGGGAPSQTGAPIAAPSAPSSDTADVLVSIRIPRDSAAARRRVQYVSAGTASMAVTVGGQTTTAACPAPATTCSASVAAPLGMQTLSIGLYDGASLLLSSGSATVTIVANTVNAVNLTFDGVVASIGLSLSTASLPVGAAASTMLTVVPKDADGYTIVQPGNYTQPIVVTTVPALPPALSIAGATTFSAIPAGTTLLAINYTGGVVPASIAFQASAGTVSATPATLTFPGVGMLTAAPNTLQFTSVPSNATVTISEPNYAGTFSVTAPSCSGIATIGAVVSGQFTVTASGVGSCTAIVHDTLGATANVSIAVATTTIVGS